MKVLKLFLAVCFLVLTNQARKFELPSLKSSGGGTTCVGCSLAIYLLEQFAIANAYTIDDVVNKYLCDLFSDERLKNTCIQIVNLYGQDVIEVLAEEVNPDSACRKLKICTDPTCNVVPKSFKPDLKFSNGFQKNNQKSNFNEVKEYPWDWISDLIKRLTQDHLPVFDVDGDKFSDGTEQLRGWHWRGKDCDDLDKKVYPGRKTNSFSYDKDYDCNGIQGINPATKKSYKQDLCEGQDHLGVGVLGDSAGAHFHLPPDWFNATSWSKSTFNGALGFGLDEFDLPHKSGYTGYEDSTEEVPVRSVYKYFLEKNRCINNDYQNCGVNGGSSKDFDNYKAIARDQVNDHPMLLFIENIGNDVCGHQHSIDSMTTPEQFKQNYLDTLSWLDTVLPTGSHVVLIGLADGFELFQYLDNKLHPLGITYNDYYDYFNCLDISPCWGWMNTNTTIRQLTQQRANLLTQQLQDIANENHQYQHFDYTFYQFPTKYIMDEWKAQGKDPKDLIEPADGFHPNQAFNALYADWLWMNLNKEHATWIPRENPNNARIDYLLKMKH